jgi:hypothetical protein
MSGNPPKPGDGAPDGLPDQVRKLRATVAILELLVPFDKNERMGIIVGVIGTSDEKAGDLLSRLMMEKFK